MLQNPRANSQAHLTWPVCWHRLSEATTSSFGCQDTWFHSFSFPFAGSSCSPHLLKWECLHAQYIIIFLPTLTPSVISFDFIFSTNLPASNSPTYTSSPGFLLNSRLTWAPATQLLHQEVYQTPKPSHIPNKTADHLKTIPPVLLLLIKPVPPVFSYLRLPLCASSAWYFSLHLLLPTWSFTWLIFRDRVLLCCLGWHASDMVIAHCNFKHLGVKQSFPPPPPE